MGLRFDADACELAIRAAGRDPVVSVSTRGNTVTLSPHAHLGAEAGGLLRELVAAAASCAAAAVEIDVGRVSSFSPAGAAELFDCRAAGAGLPGGVRYRANSHLGQEVLLAAFRARG
jgi:hypothetical protein